MWLLSWSIAQALACGVTVPEQAPSGTEPTGGGQEPTGEEPRAKQPAERVLFRQDSEDEWTAFVEIQYESDVPFTWIIPVRPPFDLETDISVVPDGLFDALEFATAPRFLSEGFSAGDACSSGCGTSSPLLLASDLLASDALPPPDDSLLLGESTAGPYDIQLIDGTDGEILVDWLSDNGYAVLPGMAEPIDHYVSEGYDFLGLQLRPGASGEGPLETIVLGCGMTEPMVPLALTALAAPPQMPITAYVLGNERVVPSGAWTEVTPEIIGLTGTEGYLDRVKAEQADAGGRAWTTEYAAPAGELLKVLAPAQAEVLGQGAYLTRFRAYVDPEEMDLDPIFVPDPSAPDVSPIHFVGIPERAGLGPAGFVGLALLLGLARRRA